jgi:iron complex outermembrane receptor protein
VKYLQLLTLSACCVEFAYTQRVGVPTDDLTKVGVEELFNVEVTSVGRKAQQLAKAPAAVFVLTAADIRRSGATCIPEALQWVPGLTVLRINGRSWSVSARGSARQYANKILVMIDGRSLYTPLFAGVIWETIDVPLEDIEQIEVVRGPGAVMWGPNAVNGVINIITRRAQTTTGLLTSVATGNEVVASDTVRWGAAPSDKWAYRIWGKGDYDTPAYSSPGSFMLDNAFPYQVPSVGRLDRTAGRMGFRLDGQPNEKNRWTVQGDLYKSSQQDPVAYAVLLPDTVQQLQAQTNYDGGYLQASWTHTASASNESTLQFSYSRDDYAYSFNDARPKNLTVDFQNRRQTSERNEVYWGAGFQQYSDQTVSQRYISFNPASYVYRAGDVVFRDEFQFVPDRWLGSAGVRLDYTSYGRLEYQPSLRLLYTPDASQSAWIAASRAIRLPSRFDRDIVFDGGQIQVDGQAFSIPGVGSKNMRSEVERSVEVGYRFQKGQRWSIDASVFVSSYSRLFALEGPTNPVVDLSGPVPVLSFPTMSGNPGAGLSHGVEIWGTWQVRHGWRLMPSYSYLHENWTLPPNTDTSYSWDLSPSVIPHQALLRSQHDLGKAWKLDLMARARSGNQAFNLPDAILADVRVSWKASSSTELSFSMKNLTNRHVLESYPEGASLAIPTRRTFVVNWIYRI